MLLNKNHKAIKNINHSLMKLVSAQQESITISKNLPQYFTMMDRVPVYLEIDAANLPFPCKILMRPNYKKHGYTSEQMEQIAANTVIYLSTKTKNPSERNSQLVIGPPSRNIFNFAPVTEGYSGFQNKIYIGVYYDLSLIEPSTDEGVKEEAEDLSHVSMVMHVSFPKDKEEMKKKRLAAMMKKI